MVNTRFRFQVSITSAFHPWPPTRVVPVKSVTNHFGDSQLCDVKSVTGVSQFGDSHNLSTNDIFRPYFSRMPAPRKIYCKKLLLNYILAGVPAVLSSAVTAIIIAGI